MTTFKLIPAKWYEGGLNSTFTKWIHQNEAELIDCIEGSLLDNYLYACKRGYCFVFEKYVNPNMSEHVFHFIPYKQANDNNPDYNALCQIWDKWSQERDNLEAELIEWSV